MVGEGRPSTSFCFSGAAKQLKTKEKRGWSAFADHDGEGGMNLNRTVVAMGVKRTWARG